MIRQHATRIARVVAERYGHHPAVRMWHVSNELACHNGRCYCDVSAAAFRDWLGKEYADIDALNLAWGTAFWGQRYASFEQILPPRRTTTIPNPGQRLDFERFSSDAFVAHLEAEAAVLREVTPHLPVTTNYMVMGDFHQIDYTQTTPLVDIVSNDHYLWAEDPRGWAELAFSADRTRGLAGGDPWILMEHSTSAVNWQPRNIAKEPGQMLRNALQHVARGVGRGAVLPVAAVPRRRGEVPLRDGAARRARTPTLFRDVVDLGATLGGSPRCGGARSSGRASRSCGTRRRGGPPSSRPTPPSTCATSTSPSACTARCSTRASRWTCCRRRPTWTGTTSSSSRRSTSRRRTWRTG